METEIIIKKKGEIITPTVFALIVALKGIPYGQTFWCQTGSLDSIKCILLSHNSSYTKGLVSVENKYTEFTVTKKQGDLYTLLNMLQMTRTRNVVKTMTDNQNMSLDEFTSKYSWRDFLRTKNSGKKSLQDLRIALSKFGYTL